jgi:hypothetical protein
MASVFAFRFVIRPVVDNLALRITLHMVGGSVSDRCNP